MTFEDIESLACDKAVYIYLVTPLDKHRFVWIDKLLLFSRLKRDRERDEERERERS